jgi:hypothetical protein
MGKDQPDPPDYAGAAQAQAKASREQIEQQTWANRPNINTPFGQQVWSITPTWDPTTGQYINAWTQNINLTPETQRALDSQMRVQQGRSSMSEELLQGYSGLYATPMSWGGLTPMAQTPGTAQYGPMPQAQQFQSQLNTDNLTQVNQVGTEGLQEVNQFGTDDLQSVDPSQRYYQSAEDAIYGQWANRMEPQFQRQEEQLHTRLMNQGLRPGDAAYDAEIEKLRQAQADARTNAQYQATIGAGQEAARMHGMDLSTRQNQFGERDSIFENQMAQRGQQFGERNTIFGNQMNQRGQEFGERLAAGNFANQAAAAQLQQELGLAGFSDSRANQLYGQAMQNAEYQNRLRQQEIAERMQERGWGINEINAMLSGQQVGMPQMPSFTSAQGQQAPNYLAAANMGYNAALDAYGIGQQNLNSALSGIGTIASIAMAYSDRRLKKNIQQVGVNMDRKLNTYQFDYIWENDGEGNHIGYMADEVEELYPEAVVTFHGYKVVNYGLL